MVAYSKRDHTSVELVNSFKKSQQVLTNLFADACYHLVNYESRLRANRLGVGEQVLVDELLSALLLVVTCEAGPRGQQLVQRRTVLRQQGLLISYFVQN